MCPGSQHPPSLTHHRCWLASGSLSRKTSLGGHKLIDSEHNLSVPMHSHRGARPEINSPDLLFWCSPKSCRAKASV